MINKFQRTGFQINHSKDGLIHTVEIFEEIDGVLYFLTKSAQNGPYTGQQISDVLDNFLMSKEV